MKTYRQTSIPRTFRIIKIFTSLLLALLVVEAVILKNVCSDGTHATKGLISEGLPSLRYIVSLQENLAMYRLRSYELMFVQEQDRPAKVAQVDALGKENQKILEELATLFPSGEGHTRVATTAAELTSYVQIVARLRTQLDKDFQVAMQILDKEIPPQVKRLDDATAQLKTFCDTFASDRAQQNIAAFSSIQTSKFTLGSVNILFAVLTLGLVIVSSSRIHKILASVVEDLSEASDLVKGSSDTVAAASQGLAEGASQQAASLEETSSSLEEMASMTRRNADSAGKAKELATRTRRCADTGSTDVRQMTTAMDAIKQSSNEISKIIKTIDEIAFQTNILALNAAVEAARAGEAGMGFAVVAEEVRNLAQRSAQAAKETAAKIQNAITNTEQGVVISGKVAQGLDEIVREVRQVDELVGEVAAASQEQSEGINQVNKAVTEMDHVTQATAARAEESASAAQELDCQAAALKEAVIQLHALVGNSAQQQGKKQPSAAVNTKPKSPSSKTEVVVQEKGPETTPSPRPQIPAAIHKTVRASDIPMEGDFKDF